MLTLSISMLPEFISTNLNKEVRIEVFPAPVRPTIPIFSAGRVINDTSFNDGIKCSLQEEKPLIRIIM